MGTASSKEKEQKLINAASSGDTAAVKKILRQGVNVNCKDLVSQYIQYFCILLFLFFLFLFPFLFLFLFLLFFFLISDFVCILPVFYLLQVMSAWWELTGGLNQCIYSPSFPYSLPPFLSPSHPLSLCLSSTPFVICVC